MSKIIVRVQAPDGTKRIELQSRDTLRILYQKVFNEFNIDQSRVIEWSLFADRNKENHISNNSVNVAEVLSHGDMIFLSPVLNSNNNAENLDPVDLKEDEVDVILSKHEGKIERKRDEQLCHHGPGAKCINCVPVEPYDLEYLSTRNPPIKYMSFHAYLRKLKSGIDKGKYTNLETLNCKIKPGCKEHPPWPKGICNKCQPNTVYLNRQPYRHVDNIMFENGQIVERFLNYWRRSGHQRVGFLYGRYEPYDGVPLGIRAVVSAIYEPPQETFDSMVEIKIPDPNEAKIKELSKKLGLKCVGWIFTDLIMENSRNGTVKHFRGNTDTFFLSAEECITAGYFQNMYKNVTKYSSEHHFGSKFVTVVVTGDATNQIHFEGYQVSNQCVSLVRDGCIVPTYDAPHLAYIRESSNEKYIPDVYFREKDKYNNEVTKIARPLPVEYLIVDLPAAFAKDPVYTFNDGSPLVKEHFPIENRGSIGEIQDFNSLNKYLKQFPQNKFLDAMTEFHLLIFLITNPTVHFEKAIDDLIGAILTKNFQKALDWSRTPEWLTVQHFFHLEGNESMANEDDWGCTMCTYLNNPTARVCGMCQTPRP